MEFTKDSSRYMHRSFVKYVNLTRVYHILETARVYV